MFGVRVRVGVRWEAVTGRRGVSEAREAVPREEEGGKTRDE